MSLKTRLVFLISAFTLILTMLIMGVLAVSQVNVNMGGSISFTADDVYAHVTGNVTGATVPPSALNVTYSATQTTGDDTVWEELTLNFDTSATPIVFSITVENLSTERTLTVTLTDTIASETPNLLKTITTTSGAYTNGDIITLDPQGETNDTVQFTLTLSVEDKNTSLSNASFGYDLQLFDVSVAPEPPELTGFTFTTSGSEGTLTSYTGSEANVVIPSSFSILDGKYVEGSDYIVTAIGDRAFYNCTSMTNITIPEGVTSIGDEAFYNCYALTEVNFGEDSQLASIGEVAFYKCTSMTNITIPEGVTRIGQHAFNSCSALTEVNFGADSLLKSIGGFAFNLCSNLTSIIIPKRVTSIGSDAFGSCYALAEVYNYSSLTIDNTGSYGDLGYYAQVIYNASDLEGGKPEPKIENDGTMQYYVDGATKIALAPAVPRESLTSVTLRPGTTEINQYAFNGCSNLTSITIPEGVASIGDSAFYHCYALAEVYNYSSRTIDNTTSNGYLGYYAKEIYNASALEGEKPATKIENDGTMQYYVDGTTKIALAPAVPRESLTSATLHSDTTEINQRAFYECSNLTSISILDSVTSIGEYAFQYCTGLTSITIPESVTSIGAGTFRECEALTEVNFGADSQLTSIGNFAFYYCSALTEVNFGADSQLASIGRRAFSGCANLASITIPSRVRSISGAFTFSGCTSLATVTIDSGDIYEQLGNAICGRLIENATTIRVLASIIDGGSYTNTYLNGSTFEKSPTADGYYKFTRK